MNTYIVQIYHDPKKDVGRPVGIVEVVGADGKLAFTNVNELWEIMNNGEAEGLTVRDAQKDRG